jgi:hypothetical protein
MSAIFHHATAVMVWLGENQEISQYRKLIRDTILQMQTLEVWQFINDEHGSASFLNDAIRVERLDEGVRKPLVPEAVGCPRDCCHAICYCAMSECLCLTGGALRLLIDNYFNLMLPDKPVHNAARISRVGKMKYNFHLQAVSLK